MHIKAFFKKYILSEHTVISIHLDENQNKNLTITQISATKASLAQVRFQQFIQATRSDSLDKLMRLLEPNLAMININNTWIFP